jgi:hypothetical protein
VKIQIKGGKVGFRCKGQRQNIAGRQQHQKIETKYSNVHDSLRTDVRGDFNIHGTKYF